MRNSIFLTIRRTGLRVLCWTAIAGLLGGSAGSLFGGIFGALWILVRQDFWQVASMVAYFGLCGGIAGALVGAYGAMMESEGSPEPEFSTHNLARTIRAPDELVRKSASADQKQPRNRLIAVLEAERHRREALASQDPSQN
jgi:hypothetical protein